MKHEDVSAIFHKANFVKELGIELVEIAEASCETRLRIETRHLQQHGSVHAGVITTLADHTAGGAARSVSGEHDVITVGFTANFLRPAVGEELHGKATVIRAGRNIIVVECKVFIVEKSNPPKLVACLIETLFVLRS